ncbi:zinc finger WD40 repeat protein 1 [Actinidia rufa]|uniref:Zinc finger WD40 repeat protein 1 n=1 Tax=Actinidia rufa TaxID=165716 RepID=A0A7J0EJ47_9ERIC|nr:zinc finger WD40 repeat protein 1 [Actinidia rufa]
MAVKTLRRGAEKMQQSINDKVRGGTVNKVCVYWLSGRCTRNPCRFLHSESSTPKPPKQSQYRHSNTWNRSTNNSVKNSSTSHRGGSGTESKIAIKTHSTCVNVVNILGEVGSLICEDPWVFVGLTNAVKDGTIVAWKSNSQTNCPELAASMKGHSGGVVSLVVGANSWLYNKSKTLVPWTIQ